MIANLLIGIGAMVVLFVVAGLVSMDFWRGCGGHCDSCSNDCEIEKKGRLP